MRLKTIIFAIPLLLIGVNLCLSNNEKITLSFWPLSFELETQIGIALVISFAAGYILNAFWNIFGLIKNKSKIIFLEQENKKLKKEKETPSPDKVTLE